MENDGGVHPFLIDCYTRFSVLRCAAEANLGVDGNVHDAKTGAMKKFVKGADISRLGRLEMRAPGLDAMNTQFIRDAAREILQAHARPGLLATISVRRRNH